MWACASNLALSEHTSYRKSVTFIDSTCNKIIIKTPRSFREFDPLPLDGVSGYVYIYSNMPHFNLLPYTNR